MTTGTEPTHWRDKVCVVCKGPLPTPTWHGQPYICCSGRDCGCGGGVLPIGFCSVNCWENYEPALPEPEPECDCAGFCQEKAGCRGMPRRMATSCSYNGGDCMYWIQP